MTPEAEQGIAALLYATSTESLIPWDWLEASRVQQLLMTDWKRVDMLLRAVNGESIRVQEWTRLCGAPLASPMFNITIEGTKLADLPVPLMDQAKRALRGALEGIIRDEETAVPEIDKNLAAIVAGKVITVEEESERGVPRERVIAHSVGAALAHSLRIVVDPEKPFIRRLQQCALPECGRFALVKPPSGRGQPPKHYCSEAHRKRHRKEQFKEWKAANRLGMDIEQYRAKKAREAKKPARKPK